MKTKYWFIMALLAATTLNAVAADTSPAPLTVAVYDFKGDVPDESLGSKVTTLVTVGLTGEKSVALVERAKLNKALNEQAFGVSGIVSSDAASSIGQLTGAKVLVTGEVVQTADRHLVIVATLVGTETGRIFADKVEGSAERLDDLTSQLSQKIAQTISDQTTNLVMPAPESSVERQERIAQSITGTNRPVVSVNIVLKNGFQGITPSVEFGMILLKAGFTVVDKNSDQKPDVEITGVCDLGAAARQGDLYSYRAVIELKIANRRTGDIITFDRQESTATDATRAGADRSSQINAVDALAERVLPLLANYRVTKP